MTTVLLGRICRTCLKKSKDMHKMREFMKDGLQIEGMLQQTIPNFDLEMDEIPLPVEICKECLDKLKISFDFVQTCHNSNKELKDIFIQQEQQVQDLLRDDDLSVEPSDFLDENVILLDNFKKDPHDDSSNGILVQENGLQPNSPNLKEDVVKLEVEMQNEESVQEDNDNSSDEYWPNDDKEDSDSNFFEKMAKDSTIFKPKRKYNRKVPLKRGSTNICLLCNKVFAKKNLFTKHLSVHDTENKFECDICFYRFSSERKLKTHISGKHTDVKLSLAGGPYPCPDCPMIFQQTRSLAAHRITHSEIDYKCQVCSMSLKTMAAVVRHMNCKHPDILPYECHLCDKAFPVENQLTDHINGHMGYKKYKCDSCEKSFPHSTALKDHMRKHTGESPFLCPHCGKSFKTANALRQHLQRHGEKKFHCPECPMKFYAKINLTQHMTSHTKLKPHVCETCGSAFTRQDSLKAHKVKHSGTRPFKCEDCNMSFFYKRHLKRHKITHTGEKPHMCSFCDRAYAASGDLVKHLRTHVGEKTYFCDQCSESFKYALELKEHKIMHYKEKQKLELEHNNEITVENACEEVEIHPEEPQNEEVEMQTEDTIVTLEELYEVEEDCE